MMDLGRAYAKEHNFHCVFPILANLYGPHDHLEPSRAHVVTDLMLRCVSSPEELIVWGTGEAQREFLYIEDAAAGVLACIKAPAGEFINIGSGSAIAILNLARLIITSHGLTIPIRLDKSKPNGQLRKVLCVKKAKELLGWHAETSLESGLKQTALWYRQQVR